MTTYPDTWLVVPMHNEGPVISEVVTEARRSFPNVVCIDDGSTDASARLALRAGALVLQHPLNLGQGAALQTGIEYFLTRTDARFLITFDADGQHRVEDAVAMRERAQADSLSFILGSRFLCTRRGIPRTRRVLLRTAAAATRMRTRLPLTDTHNGLRLLDRRAAQVVHLTHNRMAHASQIVEQLAASRLPWAEMPVHIRYTDYSRTKGQSLLNSVNILVEMVMR